MGGKSRLIEEEIQGASSSAQVPRSSKRVPRLKVYHFRIFYLGFSEEPLNLDCFKKCKVSQESQNWCRRLYTWFFKESLCISGQFKASFCCHSNGLTCVSACSLGFCPASRWMRGRSDSLNSGAPHSYFLARTLFYVSLPSRKTTHPTNQPNRPNECLSNQPKSNSKRSNQNPINIPISCSLSRGEMEHNRSEDEDRKSKEVNRETQVKY